MSRVRSWSVRPSDKDGQILLLRPPCGRFPDYPVVDGRRNNFEAREKPNLMDAVNGNATENVTASKDVTMESSTSMRELLNNGE